MAWNTPVGLGHVKPAQEPCDDDEGEIQSDGAVQALRRGRQPMRVKWARGQRNRGASNAGCVPGIWTGGDSLILRINSLF
jgi:hypothetical protein